MSQGQTAFVPGTNRGRRAAEKLYVLKSMCLFSLAAKKGKRGVQHPIRHLKNRLPALKCPNQDSTEALGEPCFRESEAMPQGRRQAVGFLSFLWHVSPFMWNPCLEPYFAWDISRPCHHDRRYCLCDTPPVARYLPEGNSLAIPLPKSNEECHGQATKSMIGML